jgi:Family of unknown function (DUF5317)
VILIVLALLCLLTVPLTGGDLTRLADLPLRWLWAAPAALALQVVMVELSTTVDKTALALLHIGTYVLVALFLWANRRIPGVRVIGIGMLANALAIVINGGVMPASITAQHLAGLTTGPGFHNSAALAHPRLLFLGDIIPVPGPLPNVLSVGDCAIFAGLLLLVHRAARTRLGSPRLRADAPLPARSE